MSKYLVIKKRIDKGNIVVEREASRAFFLKKKKRKEELLLSEKTKIDRIKPILIYRR